MTHDNPNSVLFGFAVTFRRLCDGDETKYGPAWGIYEFTIGNVTVQRHCRDEEMPLQHLVRILTDTRLRHKFTAFTVQTIPNPPKP